MWQIMGAYFAQISDKFLSIYVNLRRIYINLRQFMSELRQFTSDLRQFTSDLRRIYVGLTSDLCWIYVIYVIYVGLFTSFT